MVDISANIHLLHTEEGGRTSFIFSGYRPQICFGDDIYVDGAITFSDREKLFPGDTWQVQIILPRAECAKEYLRVGMAFDINEGPHKVVVSLGNVYEL